MTKTSEQIAGAFQQYGVTHVFYVPVILPEAMKVMPTLGITPVMTHGEKAAAYMADGYARVTGRVGVCGAQAIGSTNLAAGLRDPYMAHVPIVALSGVPSADHANRNLYQDVDDHGAFEGVTKWRGHVPGPGRWPDMLRQAFRSATSGDARPVHLSLAGPPGNVGDTPAEGNWFGEPQYGSAPSHRPSASAQAVDRAVAAVRAAQAPVILAGNGVPRSRAEQEVRHLATAASLPVVTSLNGMSTIGYDDPLSVGVVGKYGSDSGNQVLSAADHVLVLGSALGSMTTDFWSLINPSATIVQVDINAEEIGRTMPVAVPVVGDVRTVAAQLREALAGYTAPAAWLERVGAIRAEWRASLAEDEASTDIPIRPDRLVAEIATHAKDDAIIVGDTGHVGHWAARHLRVGPNQTVIRAAGSLGWGLPASLGAQCGAPDREVVCLTGDAGIYYHLGELETAVRYRLPVIVVINNNLSMNQEAKFWDDRPDQVRNWTFQDVDFSSLAKAIGCFGVRVDQPDRLGDALAAARASGLPAVVDVRTDAKVVAPEGEPSKLARIN